jgi:hypothetical protein
MEAAVERCPQIIVAAKDADHGPAWRVGSVAADLR